MPTTTSVPFGSVSFRSPPRSPVCALVFAAGLLLAFGLAGHAAPAPAPAPAPSTGVGDSGHYLSGEPRVFLNNPDGRAFRVSLFRFQWWIGGGWNNPDMKARLTAPDGTAIFDGIAHVADDGWHFDVPAGAKGVYTFELKDNGTLNFWYLRATLPQAVVGTGSGQGDMLKDRWFLCNPFVPRTWYFFVPKGTREFTVRAQNSRGRSQREDDGITFFSPRGQRTAVLWGQANPDEKPNTPEGLVDRVLRILPEPGTTGRFWSFEARFGDSHTYSDINLTFAGIPPYVARSPEEWFDGATGQRPAVALYDEDEFVQSDVTGPAKERLWQNWTPAPAMGDPDGDELRCPARIALWNPEGRALKFVIGTYLPRMMFPEPDGKGKGGWKYLPDEQHDHARIVLKDAGGKTVLEDRAPLKHLHGEPGYNRQIETGKGVAFLDVTEGEHFWTYTYPATPAVMIGQPAAAGWQRFLLENGTARQWYFFVPRGTKAFGVRVAAADATDVVHLEVCAPDRVVAVIHDNRGEKSVTVPEGMDGRVWHVRIDFGGATTFVSRLPKPRFPSLNLTLDIKDVPPYLAPTWEQWFDPRQPALPFARN